MKLRIWNVPSCIDGKLWLCIGLSCYLCSCSKKLETERQRISYTVGRQVAENIRQTKLDLDVNVFIAAVESGLSGEAPRLSAEEMATAATSMQRNLQKQAAEVAEKNRESGLKFMEGLRRRDGIKSSPSHLLYEVLKEGTGKAPHADSLVSIQYTGSLADGRIFESTHQKNEPVEVKVSGVVIGLQEGLRLMHEGSKYRFYIPPELAYGEQGRPGIPPGSVLIFEIELVKVK